jgi:tetratricopeptide (TPR) repeat protein
MRIIIIVFYISFIFHLNANSDLPYRSIKSIVDLDNILTNVENAIQEGNKDLHSQYRLSQLLLLRGNYQKTQQSLDIVLKEHPYHIDSLLLLIRLNLRQYRFKEAEKILKTAARLESSNIPLKFLQARIALLKMDFVRSEAIYRLILKEKPGSGEALVGLARLCFQQYRYNDAEKYLKKCLNIDPDFPSAYLLYAKIHRLRQHTKKWIEAVKKAVELEPLNANALAALAFVMVQGERNLVGGSQKAALALKLDPFCFAAHHYFGRGYRPTAYPELPSKRRNQNSTRINNLLRKGDRFLCNNDYNNALRLFSSALELDNINISAIIGKGVANFHLRKFNLSLHAFFKVLEIDPYYGLAHYGITQVLKRKLDNINVQIPLLENEFAAKEVTQLPLIQELFINYHTCDNDLQKIIHITAAPFANLLKALVNSGSTFYFMDMHRFLWQIPHQGHLRGIRSIDLRLWDDIKGQGGYHGNSNILQQTRVKYGCFNVTAHEFAHQIHPILSSTQKKELKRLFLKAAKENRTLDYYAKMNEQEYFSQGYEAFVSEKKLPGQQFVFSHTSSELKALDPELYSFILQLSLSKDCQENEIMGCLLKTEKATSHQERIKIYDRTLSTYGNHPQVLNAFGNEYRTAGKLEKAMNIHRKVITLFPRDVFGYIELAKDHFLYKDDIRGSIRILEKNSESFSSSSEFLSQLGHFYYLAGDIKKMIPILEQSIRLNPAPDPYSAYYKKPYVHLAMGLLSIGNYKDAEKYLLYSLKEVDGNDSRGWAELAALFLKTNRMEEGRKYLNNAFALNSEDFRVKEIKAAYLAKEGQVKASLDSLTSPRKNNSETDAVKAIALKYAEAYESGSYKLMESILHPDLSKVGVYTRKNGKSFISRMNIQQFLKLTKRNVNRPFREKKRELHTQIIVSSVYGDIADVILIDDIYVEYFHMLNEAGKWKIIHVLWMAKN